MAQKQAYLMGYQTALADVHKLLGTPGASVEDARKAIVAKLAELHSIAAQQQQQQQQVSGQQQQHGGQPHSQQQQQQQTPTSAPVRAHRAPVAL